MMKRMIKLSVVIVIAMMSMCSMALLFNDTQDDMYYQQGNKVTPPRNLQARGFNGYIELEWEAPAQNSGDVAAYMIYRSLSSDYQNYYLQVDKSNLTYTDYNVENGRTYYYWIRALTENDEMTDFSNRAEATPYGTSPPTPPRDLKAYPGNSRIILDWDKPEDDGGSSLVNYKIYRSTTPGEEVQAYTVGTGTQFTDYDVTNGQIYYYVVSALNSVGESAHSNEAYATPSSTITKPSSPRNLEAYAGNGFVELHWNEPLDDGGSAV
ncbi:MAG: fibronectin type III domain-containing protein, partial [Thermoplasmata archaeon]